MLRSLTTALVIPFVGLASSSSCIRPAEEAPPPPDVPRCDSSGAAPCGGGEFCSVTGACIAGGTCLADGDCGEFSTCAFNACTEPDCGGASLATPPVLLFVVDRSCSMTGELRQTGVTKWDAAVAAIDNVITVNAGVLHFGLTLFPDVEEPRCEQGAVPVPPAAGRESAIRALLQASTQPTDVSFPDGPCVTNIDTAMQQAADAPELTDRVRQAHVALISDGKQAGCNVATGDADTERIIAELFDRGVPTFVVGFAGGTDGAQLDAFARAGGVQTTHFVAEDPASLDVALDTIVQQALDCFVLLDEPAEFPDQLTVSLDDTPLPDDQWRYNANIPAVEILGDACATMKTPGHVIDVLFGCFPE